MTTATRVKTGLIIGVAMSLMSFGGVAAAQSNDNINNTGPGSTNVIDHSNNNSCDVNNDTDVDLNNNNPQDSNSGNVDNNNNTSSGNSNSGNSGNSSNTDVNVDVNNSGCCNTCNTSTSQQPGQGGGEVQAATTSNPQVQAPKGGVGAGEGGLASTAAVAAITVASGAVGGLRLRKSFKAHG